MHPEINKARRIKDAKEKTIADLDKIIDEAVNRLAAKDAALRQCVEALERFPRSDAIKSLAAALRYSSATDERDDDEKLRRAVNECKHWIDRMPAALTAAKEALGDA